MDRTADQPVTTPETKPTPSGETKPTTDPKAEGEPKPADPKAVPEKYDFKAPEGIALDPKLTEAITPLFKEAGISAEMGQKLFDFHVKALQDAAQAPTLAVETMRKDWVTAVNADPEMAKAVSGGKTGLDAVKFDIGRALTNLPPAEAAEFKSAMDLTGAGDHPAFVKAFWKLSQLVTEGKHVSGTNPSPHGQTAPGASAKPTAAKALYPNLP